MNIPIWIKSVYVTYIVYGKSWVPYILKAAIAGGQVNIFILPGIFPVVSETMEVDPR